MKEDERFIKEKMGEEEEKEERKEKKRESNKKNERWERNGSPAWREVQSRLKREKAAKKCEL